MDSGVFLGVAFAPRAGASALFLPAVSHPSRGWGGAAGPRFHHLCAEVPVSRLALAPPRLLAVGCTVLEVPVQGYAYGDVFSPGLPPRRPLLILGPGFLQPPAVLFGVPSTLAASRPARIFVVLVGVVVRPL